MFDCVSKDCKQDTEKALEQLESKLQKELDAAKDEPSKKVLDGCNCLLLYITVCLFIAMIIIGVLFVGATVAIDNLKVDP